MPMELPDLREKSAPPVPPNRLSSTVNVQKLAIEKYAQTGAASIFQDSTSAPKQGTDVRTKAAKMRIVKIRRPAQQHSSPGLERHPKAPKQDKRVQILAQLKSTNAKFLTDSK